MTLSTNKKMKTLRKKKNDETKKNAPPVIRA
jgi:hypothetical protein